MNLKIVITTARIRSWLIHCPGLSSFGYDGRVSFSRENSDTISPEGKHTPDQKRINSCDNTNKKKDKADFIKKVYACNIIALELWH